MGNPAPIDQGRPVHRRRECSHCLEHHPEIRTAPQGFQDRIQPTALVGLERVRLPELLDPSLLRRIRRRVPRLPGFLPRTFPSPGTAPLGGA